MREFLSFEVYVAWYPQETQRLGRHGDGWTELDFEWQVKRDFATYFKGVSRPSAVYDEIEHAARDEVLRCGGSLSHHHGIGKIRSPFLGRIQSPGMQAFARDIKRAVDPTNVFGAGNQGFRER